MGQSPKRKSRLLKRSQHLIAKDCKKLIKNKCLYTIKEVNQMPLLFESTDKVVRKYSPLRFNPDFTSGVAIFLAGVVTGFVVLPIVLPIAGYQLTKRYGPPSPSR